MIKTEKAIKSKKRKGLKFLKGATCISAKGMLLENQYSLISPSKVENTISDPFFLVNKARSGVVKIEMNQFLNRTGISQKSFAHMLSISEKTIQNKNDSSKFSLNISEKFLKINELFNYGLSVFNSWDNFKKWLYTENINLGLIVPFDLLDTIQGIEIVKKELEKIEYSSY
jgi:uncharacterized protein (DUF2384 family)